VTAALQSSCKTINAVITFVNDDDDDDDDDDTVCTMQCTYTFSAGKLFINKFDKKLPVYCSLSLFVLS
jgi:hypothetical protein